ncbi:MAG: tRNA lysidine(34) synthetase TilS [Roseovarius sp.]
MTDLPAQLRQRIAGALGPDVPAKLGVAVSGGSDSLALLTMLNDWRVTGGPELHAVTVDHGLRPEAADEARMVARLCDGWSIPHTTLKWEGWTGTGNLPDAARRARYGLMVDWAAETGIPAIAVAHTANDQAETFLMRLARMAGLDGLSAMAPRWQQGGITFFRPVLHATREELRAVLRDRGIGWADDPSNADPAFERVRARQVLETLAPLGIEATTLAEVAGNLAAARTVIDQQVAFAARNVARTEDGDVLLDRTALARLEPEITRRLLQQAILWISGADYPPRGPALQRAMRAIDAGDSVTLHGCRFITRAGALRLTREEQAVADLTARPGDVWDGRWRLSGPETEGAVVAALGENGLRHCPNRRNSALPAASLRASPAVWQGHTLLAAPLAELENGWTAELVRRENHDFAALLSH